MLSGPVCFVMTYFRNILVYTYEHTKYRSKGIYVVFQFSLCRDKILGKSPTSKDRISYVRPLNKTMQKTKRSHHSSYRYNTHYRMHTEFSFHSY